MGRKVILGLSAALVLGLWVLCAVVYVIRSRTGSYNGGVLAPFILVAAIFTVLAAVVQTRAWRRGVGMVAASLTSVLAAVVVFVLFIVLSLPGG